ncbi:MAG: TonB family protein [Candidatus Coatesbacteria bacterium]|nr:MAG: TonB family protein [Candidatus Coatesbacteria bacterium]
MAKKQIDAQDKLKKKLAGGLFRYTFMVSLVFHFGLWGIAEMPKDVLGKKGEMKMGDGKLDLKVVKKKYEDLPPPPSLEMPEAPTSAPKGLEAKGSVGEVPMPVPDELAEADTITDAVAGSGEGFGEGEEILIEEGLEVEDSGEKNPWDEVTFVEYSEAPSVVHEQRPVYPDIARDSGVEGDVVLLVYIDEQGNVRNAIVQSSPGLPALDEAAKKAAFKCKFRPAKQQGVPVGVWYSIVMQFRM